MGREEAYKFNREDFYEEIYPGPISNVSPSHPMRYIELTCSANHSWFLCEILGGCCGPPIVATFLSCPFATQGSSFFESSTIILGQTNTKRITWGNDDRGTLWHSRVTWPSGGWRLQPPVWWVRRRLKKYFSSRHILLDPDGWQHYWGSHRQLPGHHCLHHHHLRSVALSLHSRNAEIGPERKSLSHFHLYFLKVPILYCKNIDQNIASNKQIEPKLPENLGRPCQ